MCRQIPKDYLNSSNHQLPLFVMKIQVQPHTIIRPVTESTKINLNSKNFYNLDLVELVGQPKPYKISLVLLKWKQTK